MSWKENKVCLIHGVVKETFLAKTYLGVPLGVSYKCKMWWQPLIERYRERVALWKGRWKTGIHQVHTSECSGLLDLIVCGTKGGVLDELQKIMKNFSLGINTRRRKFI